MKLLEIHIDNFGTFSDRHVTGLAGGMHIVYGPNEFGKSTLLAFINRILFGFPTRGKANPYSSVSGYVNSGKLKCQLLNGDIVTIARKQGSHGGIVTRNGEQSNNDEIRLLLDNISSTFFESVYSIGLNELEKVNYLETAEIKAHIYSASLGLEHITLPDVKEIFNNKANGFFVSGSAKRRITTIYDEIKQLERAVVELQDKLSEYDNLVQTRDQLLNDVGLLDSRIKEQQEITSLIENKQKLFETYVDLKEAERKLKELPDTPNFLPDSLTNMEKMVSEISDLRKREEAETLLLKDIEAEDNKYVYNERLITNEPCIESLHERNRQYRSSLEDSVEVAKDKETIEKRIRSEIDRVDKSWTIDYVRNLQLSYQQKDQISLYNQKLEELKEIIDNVKNRLELYKSKRDDEHLKKLTIPGLIKYGIYAISILSIAGIVTSLVFFPPLSVLFALFILMGIFIFISQQRGKARTSPDDLEIKLNEELERAQLKRDTLDNDWQKFLTSLDFPPALTTKGALDIYNSIKVIQNDIESLDDKNTRIKQMKKTIEEVEELASKVTSCLDKSQLSGNLATDISILYRELNDAKAKKQHKEDLAKQIEQKVRGVTELRQHKHKSEEELKRFLATFDATDEQDFKLKYKTFSEREDLMRTIDNTRKTIEKTVGVGDHYNAFIESLQETAKVEIDRQLIEVQEQLEELKESHKHLNQEIGKVNAIIDNLALNDDLLAKQEELEIKKQQLHEFSREWTIAQVALFLLDKAANKYERERQPAVLKATSNVFEHITDGRYPTVFKSIDSSEFKIRDKHDSSKSIGEMSRGTMEQLFLSIRLGLIKVYEDTGAEPMPIIMDDILVNFDDARGPLAIQALVEFARDRQIIVLTCHQNTLDIYKKFGAREITVS